MQSGISRWNRGNVSQDGLPTAVRDVQALSMIQDREANIWIGTLRGLLRVASGVVAALSGQGVKPQSVNVLFEDREGNIWFGGTQGLERLREAAFVTYSSVPPSENVAEDNGPLWVIRTRFGSAGKKAGSRVGVSVTPRQNKHIQRPMGSPQATFSACIAAA